MSNIQKLIKRCTAWLLCMSMAVSCFHGLSWTAFATDMEESFETIKSWCFDSDTEGWSYNEGWTDDPVKNAEAPAISWDNGMLKVTVNYSGAADSGWAKAGIQLWSNEGLALKDAERITLDFSYEPDKLTSGALAIQTFLQVNGGASFNGTADLVNSEQKGTVDENGRAMATISVTLESTINVEAIHGFTICIIGKNTDYNGAIWLDNIKVEKTAPKEAGEEGLTPPATDLHGQEEQGSWSYKQDWNYQYTDQQNTAIAVENGMAKVTVDYTTDVNQNYSKMVFSNTDTVSLDKVTQVTFDFYYDTAKMTTGSFQIAVGSTEDVLKISETNLDLSIAEAVNGTLKKLPVKLTCSSVVTGTVQEIIFSLIGVNTDYKGNIWLDNIQFAAGSEDGTPPVTSLSGLEETGSWYYGNGWESNYHGAVNSAVRQETGMVRATVDYSADAAQNYSKLAISYWNDGGVTFENITKVTFDLYYDTAKMTQGRFKIGVTSDALAVEDVDLDLTKAEAVSGTLKKLPVTLVCENAFGTVQGISFLLIGVNTDYKGDIWLDNIQFVPAAEGEDIYVDATVTANTATVISGNNAILTVNGTEHSYATGIQLADPNANADTVALYQYLKAVGESDGALFGHMEDTVLKAGSKNLSESDTKDLTGSLAAINGLDCGGLFSGFAGKYNARHPGEMQLPDTNEGNIKAAALLSNEAIAEGAIMTLSMHMPNFAFTTVKDLNAAKTYDRYDYTPADSYNLSGDCMNQILPGGAFNPQFTAYLDLVAEYAQQVNGTILFRPFHENTGSWFWWGKAFCDAETYKSVFRYTVEYLRDTKNVHNLLYVYGPGSEAGSIAEYSERYPGDAYVDMVGFDTYDEQASNDANYRFMQSFEATVKLTDQFAKEHNKLFAVTETGITNSAMKKQGNARPQWFTEILDIITKSDYNCAYYMVWSNYDSNSNYYMPFAVSKTAGGTLHGHELMDPFIQFYNDQRSIFASDQKAIIYGEIKPAAPSVTEWETTGYFTAPIAGSRILTATEIKARISAEISDAVISVSNGVTEIPLATTVSGNIVSAALTEDILAQLGEAANGKIFLRCGSGTLAEISAIFNIAEEERDPYMVDNFESYYGVDSMLTAAWATNKATGSNITLTLDDTSAQDGYAMRFDYSEQSGGWAGATITKDVDWSACNALQFWTIPDGKQQKTVIQIEANTCYEVYLNEYDEYNARAGQPTLVTIPFSEFCQRDTAGNPKDGLVQDCGSVSSFGLWVNAIDNNYFNGGTVSGTIWYDNITAVTTDKTHPSFETPDSTPVTPDIPGGPTDPTPSPPVTPVQPATPSAFTTPGSGTAAQTPASPKTVTITDPVTGTVTETTTYADGSQTVVETKTDGTVITTKTDHMGNRIETVVQRIDGCGSTTTVDTSGKTITVVTLPTGIVASAQDTGVVISLPMPVISVARDAVNAPTVTLNAGNTTGSTKVEILVANASASTVAVLIKPDGTEEVIKKSVVSADGLILALENRATVKIVDRSKDFADVVNHWSADAVAFVSSRDIFSGTDANTFSPDAPMTRAMLATVLARFDGVDTTGGATWYEKGIEWAIKTDVSDGSNPEQEITREQVAVMLYRYAGSPVVSGSLDGYADAGEVSNYALAAMQWAVEQGIITGKPDNMLDSKGSATRAEMATILMRFCYKIV